jgi:hypothetical protein
LGKYKKKHFVTSPNCGKAQKNKYMYFTTWGSIKKVNLNVPIVSGRLKEAN